MKLRYNSIVSALIFLIFLGFAGLENYLVLSALLVVLFIGLSQRDLNSSILSLSFILFLHVVIYNNNFSSLSIDWLAKNFLNPVILFFLGYWLTLRTKSSNSSLKLLIYGFFLHGALNIFLYMFNPSTMVERSMINIWGGKITATLQNLLFIPMISLLFYGVYILKDKKKQLLIVVSCILAIYGSIVSASRTLLYLVVICFLINMILIAKRNKSKRLNIMLSVFAMVIILIIVYEFNIFDLRVWIENSSLGERLSNGISANDSLVDNIRWTMSLKILHQLPTHPFGNISVVHYAHNLFLDMAKYTGILPALGLFVWAFYQIIKEFSFTISSICDEWDIIIFSMSVGFMVAFFLEPVLEGLPIIFSAFCYLCGVMRAKRKRNYMKGSFYER